MAGIAIGLIGVGILLVLVVGLIIKLFRKFERFEHEVYHQLRTMYTVTCRMKHDFNSADKSIHDLCHSIRKSVHEAHGKINAIDMKVDDIVRKLEDVVDELPIHLITHHQYEHENEYNKIAVVYNPETKDASVDLVNGSTDEVVSSMKIGDHEELIGEATTYFGIDCDEPNVVYVRNHLKKVDVKVVRFVEKDDETEGEEEE